MKLSFTFPNNPHLDKVRTSLVLDTHGAKLTVAGSVACSCACNPHTVAIQCIVKGRGNEDVSRLALVERMIRASVPKLRKDGWSAAEDMTTLLVDQHMDRHPACKGVVNGEAA